MFESVNYPLIGALLVLLGMVANTVWVMANLRIENRIGERVESLKEWMEKRYVSVKALDDLSARSDERYTEITRRLAALEVLATAATVAAATSAGFAAANRAHEERERKEHP